MASKMVTARERREKELRSLLNKHREETVQGVVERLAAFVDEGEDLKAGVDCLLKAVERLVAADTADLTDAEEQHSLTLEQVDALRQERDAAARDLRQTLVEIRGTAALLFGREASHRLLRTKGPTARSQSPHRLAAQTQDVLRGLTDKDAKLPQAQISSAMTEDALRALQQGWVETLEKGLARLEEAADRLHAKRHQTDSTQLEKDETLHLHDRELSAIANLQQALLVLGRKPETARTIWQKQRPVGRPPRRKKRKRKGTNQRKVTRQKEAAASSKVSSQKVGAT